MVKRPNWKTDVGLGLIISPTILLCVPVWAALNDPAIVLRDWQFFFPLIVLPIAAGVALCIAGRRAT